MRCITIDIQDDSGKRKGFADARDEFMRAYLEDALNSYETTAEAAKRSKLNRTDFLNRLRRYGLSRRKVIGDKVLSTFLSMRLR